MLSRLAIGLRVGWLDPLKEPQALWSVRSLNHLFAFDTFGGVWALDRFNGSTLWRFSIDESPYSAPDELDDDVSQENEREGDMTSEDPGEFAVDALTRQESGLLSSLQNQDLTSASARCTCAVPPGIAIDLSEVGLFDDHWHDDQYSSVELEEYAESSPGIDIRTGEPIGDEFMPATPEAWQPRSLSAARTTTGTGSLLFLVGPGSIGGPNILYALDRATGVLHWKLELVEDPVVALIAPDLACIVDEADRYSQVIISVDVNRGTEFWRMRLGGDLVVERLVDGVILVNETVRTQSPRSSPERSVKGLQAWTLR